MKLNCTSILDDGTLVPAQIIERDDQLVLVDQLSPPRFLGKKSRLAEAALVSLNYDGGLQGNYFTDFGKFTKGAATEIVELLDECEWNCPTYIASSFVGKGRIRTVQALKKEFQSAVASSSDTSIMLSGGEPTIHPRFFDILSELTESNVSAPYLITNGRALSESVQFCEEVRQRCPSIEIYLQYDSYVPEHLKIIRGEDYSDVRQRAITNLESVGLFYTLVCVVQKGVNDAVCGEVVERNLWRKHCKGVTFQPIKFLGRTLNANRFEHSISNFDVSTKLEEQIKNHTQFRLLPHPSNPLNWSISYFGETGNCILPNALQSKLYDSSVNSFGVKRVAVIWHTDFDNFVGESVCAYPVVVREEGRTKPLFVHYNGTAVRQE